MRYKDRVGLRLKKSPFWAIFFNLFLYVENKITLRNDEIPMFLRV